MASWWLDGLNPKGLSQGDVVRFLISGTSVVPQRPLRSRMLHGGKAGWEECVWQPDGNGVGHYVAAGKILPCLVVSHSCELEKNREHRRVHVAPMLPLSTFGDDDRETVLRQLSRNLLPLTGINGLEDHCADFRCISYLDRKLTDGAERVASMSEDGLKNLQAHLADFFIRLKIPKTHLTPEL
jgi:hypothetical protein